MKKVKVDKEVVKTALAKMIADKSAVRTFLDGKTSIKCLTKKGIIFAKPL